MLVALLLRAALPMPGWAVGRQSRAADDWPFPAAHRSPLAERLFRHPQAFQYGLDGSLDAVFGLRLTEARWVLYPVSRTRGLPSAYVPPDLVYSLGHPLRELVVSDFKTMFQAAEQDEAYPAIVSGYRSAEYQAAVFEQAIQRQLWQSHELQRAEAELQAARSVAPPGRSQHQLGTTADPLQLRTRLWTPSGLRRDPGRPLAGRAGLGVRLHPTLHRRGRVADRLRAGALALPLDRPSARRPALGGAVPDQLRADRG